MTEDGKPGKDRRGLLGSLGRLFGGGAADRPEKPEQTEAAERAPDAARDASPPPSQSEAGVASLDPGPGVEPASDEQEDKDDTLVLGAAFKPAPNETEAATQPDDSDVCGSEDEQTLMASAGATGDDLVLDGSAGADVNAGIDHGIAEGTMADDEDILARWRAREDERSREYGAEDEGETQSGIEETGETGSTEAALKPEEGGASGLFWPSGEDREDREGTFPASDAWPEGREAMEAEDMGRKNDTKSQKNAGTPETEEPAVALFPGAMRDAIDDQSSEKTAVEDGTESQDAHGDTRESSGVSEAEAEATAEAPSEDEAPDAAAGVAAADEADTAGPEDEGAKGLGTALGAMPDGPEGAPAEEAIADGPVNEVTAVGMDATDQVAFEETVRRLIREELEGELGERLSRNVRKIVREEVAHALLRNR